MTFVKVKGTSSYYKDKKSKIVINRDDKEYEQILANREKLHQEQEIKNKIKILDEDLDIIKNDIQEIKSLLMRILNDKTNQSG